MRKITKQAIAAFFDAEKFSMGNTTVEVLPNVTILRLHGNVIAYRYNDPQKTLSVTTCGWNTRTTQERLNGLPGVRVNFDKGQMYLNGQVWDGEMKDI